MDWNQNNNWLTNDEITLIDNDVELEQNRILQSIQQNQPVKHVPTRKRKLQLDMRAFFSPKTPKTGTLINKTNPKHNYNNNIFQILVQRT